MTKGKASDVLGRMKAAANREKPISTAQAPLPEEPTVLPASAVLPRSRRVRFTLDLEPEAHKRLKRFALEADADASEVMRALLSLLDTDTAVQQAILTAVRPD